MDNSQPTTGKFALTFGLLLGIASAAFAFILYTMDLHYQGGTSVVIISTLLTLAFIVIGMYQFKTANSGIMSFGQALKVGVGVGLISAVISIGFNLLLTHVIDPETLAKSIEFQRQNLIENSELTLEQIDMQLEMAQKFSTPAFQAGLGLLASAIFSFLLALIPAAILKKNEEE
jgi:hypothetical protein